MIFSAIRERATDSERVSECASERATILNFSIYAIYVEWWRGRAEYFFFQQSSIVSPLHTISMRLHAALMDLWCYALMFLGITTTSKQAHETESTNEQWRIRKIDGSPTVIFCGLFFFLLLLPPLLCRID